ncbi:MAG: SARP family transcriptional regulator, partial [Streptosporangiaceae bacterium]
MAVTGMRFRLLQGVAAELDGEDVVLGPPRERLLLAVLLEANGALVPVDRLVECFWPGAAPPRTARDLIHEYAKKLRGRLVTAGAGPVIPRGSGGYRTEVPRENVDLYRFRDLLTEARSARFP